MTNPDIQSLIVEKLSSGLTDEELADEILVDLGKQGRRGLAVDQLEKERMHKEEGIRYYEPFDYPGGQLDFHKSDKKERLVISSNRGGKTTADVAEAVWWATGTHPYLKTPKPPVRIRVCCTDFLNGIEKVMIPMFKEFVIREDLRGGSWETAYSKEQRTLNWKNNSFVEMMSYDQDVEKFGGVKRDLVIEDEPSPFNIHDENTARLVDLKGHRIMTATPANLNARTSWIYDYWLKASGGKDPDVASFFFDIYKNTSLSKEDIDRFVASLPESERVARVEGRFPHLAGLIYKNFSRAKHVIEPFDVSARKGSIYIGIDPHPRKATGVVFMFVDPHGDKYIFDEIKMVGTARVLVDMIRVKLGKLKLEMAVMDDSASTPNEILGGYSIQREFLDPDRDGSNRGIYAVLVSGKRKDVNVGIRLVQDHLGLDEVYQKPRLFVFSTCVETIHEFETYLWDDYKNKLELNLKESPLKKNDDLMDPTRYVLMFDPVCVISRFADPSESHIYCEETGAIIG